MTPGQSAIKRHGDHFRQRLKGAWQLGPVLLCLLSVLGLHLFFAFKNPGLIWMLPLSLPLVAVLGAALFYYTAYLWRLQARMAVSAGILHTAFLLFFLFLLGFVVIYFILLTLPLGMALKILAGPAVAVDYRRFSLDLAAVDSLIFWVWSLCKSV